MAVDPQAQPVASDDVDAVQWLEVQKLRGLDSKFKPRACLTDSVYAYSVGMHGSGQHRAELVARSSAHRQR
jgi:hypothetical protein